MVAYAGIPFLFKAEYYSIVREYHILFIHSSGVGHLGGFHLLAIAESAAMHMGVLHSFS